MTNSTLSSYASDPAFELLCSKANSAESKEVLRPTRRGIHASNPQDVLEQRMLFPGGASSALSHQAHCPSAFWPQPKGSTRPEAGRAILFFQAAKVLCASGLVHSATPPQPLDLAAERLAAYVSYSSWFVGRAQNTTIQGDDPLTSLCWLPRLPNL